MKQFIILAALFAITLAYSEVEYQNSFRQWMITHQKSYAASDFQTRYNIFKTNMNYVRDWNAKGSSTVLGLTHLADLTNAEYQKIYLGTHFDGTDRIKNAPAFVPPTTPNADTVNWVTKGAVTPIKNQGQCGSCWSFSTTGSTEGAHFLAKGNLPSLSEQNLMDCSTSYGNAGCNGGLMDNAFKYIIANGGIDTEASYPYTAADGTCHYSASNSGSTLASYKDVTSGSETALETAVNARPVSVAIDASHNSFQLYSSGVYYEAACSTTALDHGVLAVGYGTDGSTPYWIVKNSWGTSWGQAGYIWMSRNKGNNCGIATMASYPTL